MLKNSPKRIGETAVITIEYDPSERSIQPHPNLIAALGKNAAAKEVFDNLTPSRRNEIVRYISMLKTEESALNNINRAIDYLIGNGRFVGRDKP